MCNSSCIVFGTVNLVNEKINDKSIIEIGSLDVNGSLRPILEAMGPKEYIGVDIQKGPGVDVICKAEDLINHFGKERFDIVLSTEMLEHVKDWRKIVSNIKNICKPGGIILITTRSKGFPYHGYPYDFWRYEEDDMRKIFSDCLLERIEKDKTLPGIFLKLRKPISFKENNLTQYSLYSVIESREIKELTEKQIEKFEKWGKWSLFWKQKNKNFYDFLKR